MSHHYSGPDASFPRIASRIADDDQAGSTSNFSRRKLLLAGAAAGLGLPFGTRKGEAGTGGLEPERLVDLKTLVKEETTTTYFPDFSAESIKTSGTTIHVLRKGSGRPLLLLHGYPETHLTWHKVAPQLAEQFSVVVPDLRGYGDSGKPQGGERHENYSFRAMAMDQVDVMRHYGHERFLVAAHDRGARVAHRLCLDHPDNVEKVCLMDIAPTLTMYQGTNQEFATKYMWWFFLIQPFPIPEHMIGLDPEFYLREIFGGLNKTPGAIGSDEMSEYVRAFSNPAAIHTSCEDFRASADIDLEMDKSDEQAGKKIKCPLHVLWGGKNTVGALWDVLATWREKCAAPVTGKALDCGHFLQEESPQAELHQFFFF
jgi:haloacetate dehalogenase